MASFQVILLIIGCVQSSNDEPKIHSIIVGDHVVIDGSGINGRIYSNEIGFVGRTNIVRDNVSMIHVALMLEGKIVFHDVPEQIVDGYFVINASSNEKYVLNENDRDAIRQRVDEISGHMAAQRDWGHFKFISLRLGFGEIAQIFGFSGFCYAYNIAVKEFEEDCIECLKGFDTNIFVKFDHAPFVGARRSNLIFIKTLGAQNDTELHRRVQHLSNSYGQFMGHTGRDQTGYLVQSLSDPKIKLRIKQKYLRQVSDIHMPQLEVVPADNTMDGSTESSQMETEWETVPSIASSDEFGPALSHDSGTDAGSSESPSIEAVVGSSGSLSSRVTEDAQSSQIADTLRVEEDTKKNENNTPKLVVGSVTLVIGSIIMPVALGFMAFYLLSSLKSFLIIPIAFALPSCAFLNAYLEYFSFHKTDKIRFKMEAIEQSVFYLCCGCMMLCTFNHSWKIICFRSVVYGTHAINHCIKWIYRIFILFASIIAAGFPIFNVIYAKKSLMWSLFFMIPIIYVHGLSMIVIKIKNRRFIKTEKWENLLYASLQKCYFEWIAMHYFLWSTLLIAFIVLIIRLLDTPLLTEMFILFGHCVISTIIIFILIRMQKTQRERDENRVISFPIYSNSMALSSGGQTTNDSVINLTPKYKNLSPHSFRALMDKEVRGQMDNKTYCDLIAIVDEWSMEKVIALIKLCGKQKEDKTQKPNLKNPKVPMLSLLSNKSDETSKISPCSPIDFSKLISHRKSEKWKQRAKDYKPKIETTKEENWQYWFFSGDCSTADIIKDSSAKCGDNSDPSAK